MIRETVEIAILGAGFAGSLLALLLHRRGRRVVLLERGRHPRFSLGESSTPLANLALRQLAQEYDLPWLADLSEHGRWKKFYPHLECGLKRGFTFIGHRQPEERLLVTANPNDEQADTHWLRADFDAFLVDRAVELGVPYLDQVELTLHHADAWRLQGHRGDEPVDLQAAFLVDATGPTGVLARWLELTDSGEQMQTASWSIYSHFVGVERWECIARSIGWTLDDYPYRCDDAALHHVIEGGWIWVLRFDNGLTSAGLLLDPRCAKSNLSLSAEQEWQTILARYPRIAEQFAQAEPVRPFTRTGRLQRRINDIVGPDWALLGPSAYTLDALYSTGNGHALQTVRRLARVLERDWGADLQSGLHAYQDNLRREIDFLDSLVAGTYQAFRHFGLLAAFSMYYFAGAITSEERHKQGRASEADAFLHSHDREYRAAVERGVHAVRTLAAQPTPDVAEFRAFVAREIAPWNRVGLCDPAKRDLYPY